MSDAATSWNGNDLVVRVRVQPRASRDEIVGIVDSRLRIRTTASPVDGKVNRAVIRMLATHLHVPPSRIRLTHGLAHRDKRLLVTGPVAVPKDLRVAADATNGL